MNERTIIRIGDYSTSRNAVGWWIITDKKGCNATPGAGYFESEEKAVQGIHALMFVDAIFGDEYYDEYYEGEDWPTIRVRRAKAFHALYGFMRGEHKARI
jgi:hypothetical protein